MFKQLEDGVYLGPELLKKHILKWFRRSVLYNQKIFYNEMVYSEHYSFEKWFSSSYLENAMKSAVEQKAVNNKIMQWKTTNSADKANLLSFKVSRSLGILIFPCESPSFDVYDILIPQVILLYFPFLRKSLLSEKNSVGCGVCTRNRWVGFKVIS